MTRSTKRKKKVAPKTVRNSRGAAARPTRIEEFLKRIRVQRAIKEVGGEVKSLRGELRLGIDRLAKRIESFGRSLQTRSRSKR